MSFNLVNDIQDVDGVQSAYSALQISLHVAIPKRYFKKQCTSLFVERLSPVR